MPKKRRLGGGKAAAPAKRPIERYEHTDKQRFNNPPVGLVTAETEKDYGKKTYAFDPHLDPRLEWTGKAEHTSFEVPTVSLHVHERIDPKTIIQAIRKRNGDALTGGQLPLFELKEENPPLREALDFYKHPHGWSNRLIAGDSLLVMNSLIEKEGMAGQVQMIYIDPPYGVRYGSNFQPFVNKKEVKDGKDDDLTQEPEMVRAFRDTWELGIHSYLTYLRDRLLLVKELLTESGSVFVQISDENLHHVGELLDEVFGSENRCGIIPFVKTSGASSPWATVNVLATTTDYLLWYASDIKKVKYRQLYLPRTIGAQGGTPYSRIELPDGTRRPMTREERDSPDLIPVGSKIYSLGDLTSSGWSEGLSKPLKYRGKEYLPGANLHWKTTPEGLSALARAGRIEATETRIGYVRYADDFPVYPLTNCWTDTASSFMEQKVYAVQTTPKVIARCILMSTDPGDIVFDPTCGSGTLAYVAEQWGRRWITCDTSRVALTLAKQRLLTAIYDYFELQHSVEGVGSGFRYRKVPHVMLRSIANNEPIKQEVLYDQPIIDPKRVRVTGPFTVEAVPAPGVKPLADPGEQPEGADVAVGRSGATLRQSEWSDELLKTGLRGKGGQKVEFSRVESGVRPVGGSS